MSSEREKFSVIIVVISIIIMLREIKKRH